MDECPQLWIAVRAARRAGEELQARFTSSRPSRAGGNSGREPPHERRAEEIVLAEIRQHFPDDNVISEPSRRSFATEPRWIVDPLDGIVNFGVRIPHYATSIAFEGGHRRDVSVVYHVPTDTVFTAIEDGGAYANGRPLSVSETDTLSAALVATGFDQATMDAQTTTEFQALVTKTCGVRRFGSAAAELAMVAAGQFDAFFERQLSVWDTAAGALLVEEAGGEVTRIEAMDGDNSEMILASNADIHRDVVALVTSGAVPTE